MRQADYADDAQEAVMTALAEGGRAMNVTEAGWIGESALADHLRAPFWDREW